ncbi:MAG: gamma-glutamylcyclotransferase family protein [Fuerstiella sp.]
MKNDETNVFVYGSLKRGYALHSLLAGQKFLGTANTKPIYKLYDCGHYPGLIAASLDGISVTGEVYCVDNTCLQRLHDAEGVDEGLYSYGIIDLLPPFSNLPCHAYFYLLPTDKLKNCGSEWPATA